MSGPDTPGDLHIVQYPYGTFKKPPKRLYVPKNDQVITHSITGAGYWDFRALVNLYGACAKGGCFVEVGANIGSDTVLASDFFSRCYAFEPATQNIELFRKNMELNQITNVELIPAAVSDQPGTADLFTEDAANSGSISLRALVPSITPHEPVQVLTLDSALPPTLTNVTFLHIDTEGHDIKVLNGGRHFIARQAQRPMIKMEYQPRALAQHGSHVNDLIGFARDFGYNVIFNASGNYVPLSPGILTDMFQLWQASNGWIDLYLWP